MKEEETDQSQNSRLSISLEKHFDKVITDLDEKISLRFDLMQLAITKAEHAANERANKANEWRDQYNQQEKVFIRKDEVSGSEKLLEQKIESVNNKIGAISKLVYIGLGVWIVLQIIIGAVLALIIQ
jgi:lysyl-tRNA synthetase class I